jgi:hypothetical protein
MKVKISSAINLITRCLNQHIVPYLVSSPGMGKSAIAKVVADNMGLYLIDMRLCQMDPTEVNGFPWIHEGVASYVPMDVFPIVGKAIPDGYKGWLILLDELSSALPATQAAAYKLVYDHMVGQTPLHEQCYIMAAGNLSTDNAVVEDMSTALASRMVHIHLGTDVNGWKNWAMSKIDPRILAYVSWKKEEGLNNFDPTSSDPTFACQRTWEMASKLIKDVPVLSDEDKVLLWGTIGSLAVEFTAFESLTTQLPSIEQIVADPRGVAIPERMDMRYALTAKLVTELNENNALAVTEFNERFPMEFVMLFGTIIVSSKQHTLSYPSMVSWLERFTKRFTAASSL